MTAPQKTPLVLLAGSGHPSPRRVAQGAAARFADRIEGYKAQRLSLDGRPLLEVVAEQFRRVGAFDPIVVVGPRRIFGPLTNAPEILDSDSSFGGNIRHSFEVMEARCPRRALAIATADLLPDPESVGLLMEHWQAHSALDLWMPFVRASSIAEDADPFAIKPTYRLRETRDSQPVAVLPSQLVIARPRAVRSPFAYRLLDVAYETRETSVASRRRRWLQQLLLTLILGDVGAMARFRRPDGALRALRAGLAIARGLEAGTLCTAELERHLGDLLLARPTGGRDARRVATPISTATSLAMDIDTYGQAEAAGLAVGL